MAYKFSTGKRGFGDITFEDDADTGIDFEADTVKIETGGAERFVVENAQATLNVPLHISQSTTEGLVITKGDGDYREIQFKTIISGTPTDTAFLQVRSDEGLSIGCQSANDEIIFMTTDGGGTTGNAMVLTAAKTVGIGNRSWEQNATAPSTILHLESAQPTITFSDSGTEKGTIGINTSDNILIENKTANKHIVFKVLDQATVKEGLRLDGAVPEVVVNQTSDSLVDFRVESDNNEHMLFVDGSEDKIGIGTNAPDYTLDVAGNIGVNQYIYHNGDGNTWINFTDNRIRLNAGGNNFIDCEDPGSAPHKVRINNGGNNIDFVIKNNSNSVYFAADASTSRIGIGTDTPDVALDINSDAIRIRNNNTPSSASDFGHKGEIRWDTNYLYICVATDTWKRVALSTW